MQSLKQNLLIAAGLLVLGITGVFMNSTQAAAQNPQPGSAPVNLVAPLPLPVTGSLGVTGTVNVRDVDNIARTPFQASLRSDTVDGRSFTVDSGKSLTIEFVSSDCSVQTGAPQTASAVPFSLRTIIGTETSDHYFYPKFSRVLPIGQTLFNTYYGSSDMTRIYADSGTTVSLSGFLANYDCFLTVSGYTVPS